MFSLVSKKKKSLKKKEINSILKLKDTHWKFGIKSQIEWFKKNIKKNDIHNLLVFREKVIGYTLLRPRRLISTNKKKYLYFDTLIIEKKYRNKNLSSMLMEFNNQIICRKNLLSFLITLKKNEKYYNKFGWKKLKVSSFNVMDHKFDEIGMIFNNLKKSKKFEFYLYQ